jgi:hypothetical protein
MQPSVEKSRSVDHYSYHRSKHWAKESTPLDRQMGPRWVVCCDHLLYSSSIVPLPPTFNGSLIFWLLTNSLLDCWYIKWRAANKYPCKPLEVNWEAHHQANRPPRSSLFLFDQQTQTYLSDCGIALVTVYDLDMSRFSAFVIWAVLFKFLVFQLSTV